MDLHPYMLRNSPINQLDIPSSTQERSIHHLCRISKVLMIQQEIQKQTSLFKSQCSKNWKSGPTKLPTKTTIVLFQPLTNIFLGFTYISNFSAVYHIIMHILSWLFSLPYIKYVGTYKFKILYSIFYYVSFTHT